MLLIKYSWGKEVTNMTASTRYTELKRRTWIKSSMVSKNLATGHIKITVIDRQQFQWGLFLDVDNCS